MLHWKHGQESFDIHQLVQKRAAKSILTPHQTCWEPSLLRKQLRLHSMTLRRLMGPPTWQGQAARCDTSLA